MATGAVDNTFYADPTALAGLKRSAAAQTPEALRETARQFESLFSTMMLKSMRDATPKDSLFGSDQQGFYQDMFDQQLATQLSKGKGLGLADVLVKQLMMQSAGLSGTTAQTDAVPARSGAVVAQSSAADTDLRSSGSNWPPRSREEFVRAMAPEAEAAAQKLGVDPATIIAHAALETGWGRHMPATADGQSSNNLFGIKAGTAWRGATATTMTTEFEQGTARSVPASFRAYESPGQSLRDYTSLLQNPRYAAARGTGDDALAFGRALQSAGYATDPDYAMKLSAVARELKSRFVLPITSTEA